MALSYVWRLPARREVELALWVTLRMVHVPGWARLAVAVEPRGATWCGVELADYADEEMAHTWARTFDRRYLTTLTVDELLAEPARFGELYINAGIAALMDRVEREEQRREEARRRAREQRG